MCVAGSTMQCTPWDVLSESVDPSTLSAGHATGGKGGSKEAKTKKDKGLTSMSMAKRREGKKAKGKKAGGKKIDKDIRGQVL